MILFDADLTEVSNIIHLLNNHKGPEIPVSEVINLCLNMVCVEIVNNQSNL